LVTFQDEARFGRLSDSKGCWAPSPMRPIVKSALIREYEYVFGTIAPKTGQLDYMIAPSMKTENMSKFLKQVSRAHKDKFVVMVVDGASSHKSKDLVIPDNLSLIVLPPYSPELNPAERLWNNIRRDYIANHFFDTLDGAMAQCRKGLKEVKRNKEALKSLTYWPWIRAILDAN
jgi:transposase